MPKRYMKAVRAAYKASRGYGGASSGVTNVPFGPQPKHKKVVRSIRKNLKVSLQRDYTFELLDDNTIRIEASFQRWNQVIASRKDDEIKYHYEIGGGEYGTKIVPGDEHLITPEVEAEVRRIFHGQSLT